MNELDTVNRAALVVRPKEPFLSWAEGVGEESAVRVEELRHRMSIYLVPEDPTGRAETAPLEEFYETVFENELTGWHADETAWPEERSFDVFLEWFDLYPNSLVWDAGVDEISSDRL